MSTKKTLETATGADLKETNEQQSAIVVEGMELILAAVDKTGENNTPEVTNKENVVAKANSSTTKKKAKEEKKPAASKKTKATVIRPVTAKAKSSAATGKDIKTEPKTVIAKQTKPVAKKETSKKDLSIGSKRIRLAASTYHYYRNWLAEFMRSHGVPSAKFQKAPESYNGHITVLETEKAKGLKALEQWSKQNPDTKELFWDVKK